ncbi:MAG: RNA 2',3'-cyclic phosphodiesterase [Candidatus Dependentiae bacterium]|nr:RNA 2',3'-cyclic phosphodiesterase [Candidatus Dependentiae bacterium]
MAIKRLFIALDLPIEVQQHFYEVCTCFEEKKLFQGRCIAPQQIHLTLLFLGDVAEENIPTIQQSLAAIKVFSFAVKTSNLGVFYTGNKIKILHVEVYSPELSELVEKIHQLLMPYKPQKINNKPFVGHITLARIKNVLNEDLFLQEIAAYPLESMTFKANSFSLMESILSYEGASYKFITTYDLVKSIEH